MRPPDRNNFRIYHDPHTSRMVFIPHGMDLIFNPPGLPLNGPWRGIVAHAFMETAEGERFYLRRVADLGKLAYQSDDLDQRITVLSRFLTDHAPQDSHGLEAAIADLRSDIRTRRQFVLGGGNGSAKRQ